MESINLSVSILCVPERYDMAKSLYAKIQETFSNVQIFCDIRYKGSWYGTRQCWLQMPSTSTHHIVMEEDIELCKNFFPAVEKILQVLPKNVISFYSLKSEKPQHDWANKRGLSWFVNDAGSPGPAVLMPREYIYSFLRFCDEWVEKDTKYEDSRLWGWQTINGIHTWTTNPNLVEHIGQMRSSLGFNSAGKTSACYIGDKDPLEIDWSIGAVPERIFKYMESDNFIKGFKGKIIRG